MSTTYTEKDDLTARWNGYTRMEDAVPPVSARVKVILAADWPNENAAYFYGGRSRGGESCWYLDRWLTTLTYPPGRVVYWRLQEEEDEDADPDL